MTLEEITALFPKGSRVRHSEKYLEQFRPKQLGRQATVRGYSHDCTCLWVVFDGRKTAQDYHHSFFVPAESAPVQTNHASPKLEETLLIS